MNIYRNGRGSGERKPQGNSSADLEPLAVAPKQGCRLLGIGHTRLYQLLKTGELESYRDGRSRKITVASIRAYVLRMLTAAGATGPAAQRARSELTDGR